MIIIQVLFGHFPLRSRMSEHEYKKYVYIEPLKVHYKWRNMHYKWRNIEFGDVNLGKRRKSRNNSSGLNRKKEAFVGYRNNKILQIYNFEKRRRNHVRSKLAKHGETNVSYRIKFGDYRKNTHRRRTVYAAHYKNKFRSFGIDEIKYQLTNLGEVDGLTQKDIKPNQKIILLYTQWYFMDQT